MRTARLVDTKAVGVFRWILLGEGGWGGGLALQKKRWVPPRSYVYASPTAGQRYAIRQHHCGGMRLTPMSYTHFKGERYPSYGVLLCKALDLEWGVARPNGIFVGRRVQ